VPLPYIRDILGHVDLSTTEIYARASTEAKRKVLEAAHPGIVTSDLPEWNQDPGLLEHCTCGGWPRGRGASRWREDPSARVLITMMPTRAPPPVPPRPAGQVNDLLPLGDWVRHHSLRSWPVLLFLLLICVPPIALFVWARTPAPARSTTWPGSSPPTSRSPGCCWVSSSGPTT
jgi:hypothetical protein